MTFVIGLLYLCLASAIYYQAYKHDQLYSNIQVGNLCDGTMIITYSIIELYMSYTGLKDYSADDWEQLRIVNSVGPNMFYLVLMVIASTFSMHDMELSVNRMILTALVMDEHADTLSYGNYLKSIDNRK